MAKPNAALVAYLVFLLTLCMVSHRAWSEGHRAFSDNVPATLAQLSIGYQEPKLIKARAGVTPLFILGTDRVSVLWFKQHRERFHQLRAIGFVVDPISQAELRQFRAELVFDKLFRLPSIETFLGHYDVAHYPVLVDVARGLIAQ